MATRSEKSRNKVSPRASYPQERGAEGTAAQRHAQKSAPRRRMRLPRGSHGAPSRMVRDVKFGREVCGNLDAAEAREWLVTNGIGGFASGTIAGCMTRRYHGLLIAALQPPVGRTHLVAGVDEIVRYAGRNTGWRRISGPAARWIRRVF